jgi:hypothetical protein
LISGQILIFLLAGLIGGIVNAAAGGAKLFVFPLLLAADVPPIAANATSTVSLWPGQLPAVWVTRKDLIGAPRALFLNMLPPLAGALCGALTLIYSTEAAFLTLIPFMLLIAVSAILLGKRLASVMQWAFPGDRLRYATHVMLFGAGFYAGYFGAGLGFILLAVLSVAGGIGLHHANAAKNLFAFGINTTAIVPLSLSGLVDWRAAVSVLLGGLAGGYLGARLTRMVPEWILRWVVAGLGLVLTASFLLR